MIEINMVEIPEENRGESATTLSVVSCKKILNYSTRC